MIFVGLGFGGVEEEASGDAAIVLDGFEQFLLVLLAHAGQTANLAFLGQLLYAFGIADVIGAPDQGDGLRAEALNLQQVEHRGVIFLEQLGVQREPAFFKHFLQVQQHSLADAGDGENFLGFADQVCNLLRQGFDGFCGVAVGADAEGILAVDFEQVGGFVEDAGDGFVVHAKLRFYRGRVECGVSGRLGKKEAD